MDLLAWTLVTCGVTAWTAYIAGKRHGREEEQEAVARRMGQWHHPVTWSPPR